MRQSLQRIVRATLCTLAGLAVSAPLALAQFPTSPPPAGPLRELQLPPFDELALSNGLQIVLVENHELPVVTVWLTLQAGAVYEAMGKEGLSQLTSDLLLRGTNQRSAEEIAAAIEGVGSTLDINAGNDFFNVSTTVLTDHVELGFDLVSDVVLRSTFPEDEVDLTRTRMLSNLQAAESQPGFLADKFFNAALYGDHPYGRTATSATVEKLTRSDITQFAAMWFKPRGSLLVVAGDMTRSRLEQLARRYFGEWSGAAPARPAMTTPNPKPTEILLVNRPGSAQSNILVGNLTLRPGDPDYFPATVGNYVLGGGGDARLFMILREQKGWTYGAYSSQNQPVDVGRFQANTEVRTEVTDSALVELLTQIRRMRTEPVSSQELDAARGFLVGSFPRQIERPQQIASQVRTTRLLDLGDDYLQTYRQRLSAVTADDIQSVSNQIMRVDSAVIVVVGDGAAIYDKLTAIAPVRLIDVAGIPLTPADLAPEVGELAFDASQIVAGKDSFAVMVQGNEFGYLTRSFEAGQQDGRSVMTVTSIVSLGPFGSQTSTMTTDLETMRPTSYDQSGRLQGSESEVHLIYANGRITGNVSVPRPQEGGRHEATIDTVAGAHVIDDNMIQAFANALPLAEGASFTVAAYDGSEGRVQTITLQVSDGGSVTVPAGEFATWKVAITGAAAPLEYWISKAEPRQLAKIAIIGQPLEFHLVKGR